MNTEIDFMNVDRITRRLKWNETEAIIKAAAEMSSNVNAKWKIADALHIGSFIFNARLEVTNVWNNTFKTSFIITPFKNGNKIQPLGVAPATQLVWNPTMDQGTYSVFTCGYRKHTRPVCRRFFNSLLKALNEGKVEGKPEYVNGLIKLIQSAG